MNYVSIDQCLNSFTCIHKIVPKVMLKKGLNSVLYNYVTMIFKNIILNLRTWKNNGCKQMTKNALKTNGFKCSVYDFSYHKYHTVNMYMFLSIHVEHVHVPTCVAVKRALVHGTKNGINHLKRVLHISVERIYFIVMLGSHCRATCYDRSPRLTNRS